MNFKIRSKYGDWYSAFSENVSLSTPIVFKTNQSTLTQVLFTLNVSAGKTVNVNWGDLSNNDYVGNGDRTHDYASTQNPYYITLTGDINYITSFVWGNNNLYCDVSKWNLPTSASSITLNQAGAGNGATGDISEWNFPSGLTILNLSADANSNKVSGDFTGKNFPENITRFYFPNQNLTVIPRGNYKNFDSTIGLYLSGNNCSSSEVDAILDDMNTFFTSNTPIKNSKFLFTGAGMGIPSASGLAAKASIEAIYTAAGFKATITVNS